MTTITDNDLRNEARELLESRDMRFYSDELALITPSNLTAGEMIRLDAREPWLDHEGAAVFVAATIKYALPAWDRRELIYFIHAAKLCPVNGRRA